MAQQTRLGLYGGPRPVYGSFSGKADQTPAVGTTYAQAALNTLSPIERMVTTSPIERMLTTSPIERRRTTNRARS